MFDTEDRYPSMPVIVLHISTVMYRVEEGERGNEAKDTRCGKLCMLPFSKARCIYTYRLFIMNNRIAICLFQMESKRVQAQQEYREQRVLNILAQLTEKSTELTEQCSVEQHDVSALNGE